MATLGRCVAAVLGTLLLALSACQRGHDAPTAQPASSEPHGSNSPWPTTRLYAGSHIERDFQAESVHAYRLELQAGEYAHVVIEQRGVDVALRLKRPDGRVLFEADAWQGQTGAEEVAVAADAAGAFTLLLYSPGARDAGRYRLRVVSLRTATIDDRRRAEVVRLSAEADRLRATGWPDALHRAREIDERAAEAWRALGARRELGRTLRQIGATRAELGDVPAAVEPLEEALRLARRPDDPQAAALALGDLVEVYWRLSRLADARRAAERALHAARRARDRAAEAVALDHLGMLARNAGNFDEALVRHEAALDIWRALGDRRRGATTQHYLGEVFTLLGRPAESLEFFRRALRERRCSGSNLRLIADSLAWLGWVEHITGFQAASSRHCDEAAQMYAELGDQRGMVWAAQSRGDAQYALRHWDAALAAYRQGLELAERGTDLRITGTMHGRIARVYGATGRVDEARRAFAEAAALLRHTRDHDSLTYLRLYEAGMWRDQGSLDVAERLARQALHTIEGLRRAAGSDVSRRTYLATRAEFYEFLVDLLVLRDAREPGRGFGERAFEMAESARARALLDGLAHPREARSADGTLAAERALSHAEGEHQRLRAAGAPLALLAAAAARVDAALHARELAQATAAWTRAWSVARPLDLRAIRRDVLDDETLLLAYAVGEEHSYLWLVGRSVFRVVRLPSRQALIRLAEPVYEGFQSRGRIHRAQALRQAARLSDAVLLPVLHDLGHKRLLIVADGPLQYIPFAALPVPPTSEVPAHLAALDWPQGRVPLLAEHEITSAPSASVLALLRHQKRGPAPPGLLAVVADPVLEPDDERLTGRAPVPAQPDTALEASRAALERSARDSGAHLQRLKWTAVEAHALLNLARPAPTFAALGLDANRDVVLGGHLGDYKIVHFATHGLLNPRHPDLSGLVLSRLDARGAPREGFLRVHELGRLGLRAELVVLSACQTALGQDVRGEGLVGLTQGFLHAGATSVVVSLWNVVDQPTSRLMERFYHALLTRGLRPAAALREAQLEMLRAGAAPIDWAGFVYVGDH